MYKYRLGLLPEHFSLEALSKKCFKSGPIPTSFISKMLTTAKLHSFSFSAC